MLMKRAATKLLMRALVSAWDTWASVVADLRAEKVEADRQQSVLSRALRRLANMAIGSAFSSWHDWAAKEKEVRVLMKRAATKLLMRALVSAWDTWASVVADSRADKAEADRQQSVLSRALRRLANKHINSAFSSWYNMA
eukprot:SAG22_NODE_7680_length_717_cov_5.168285_1_plen_139_part_01